jgi:ATP-dependent RNA helicase DDX51/DBP6
MPAAIYSRFVPPKCAIQVPASSSPQPTTSPKPAPSKKEKRSKNHQDHELAQQVEEPGSISNAAQSTLRDIADSPPDAVKKPKKRKRDPAVDDVKGDAEAGSKKHKSILSKFEKVSKKAQEHALKRQEAGEESDDVPEKEQRVLRGRLYPSEGRHDT